MKTSIIRIAAMLWGVLLLVGAAGCARLDAPRRNGEIYFRAGAALLRDDATKAGTLKEGTAFAAGDKFKVFGRRDTDHDGHDLLFNSGDGCVVTKQSSGSWTYSPVETWNWTGTESDHYEFVGIYPVRKDPADEESPELDSRVVTYPGNIAVSTSYDITSGDNFDLMAATYYRDGSIESQKKAIVPMQFYHMTSAVNIEVENNSSSMLVKICSIKFKNITVSGNAFVTMTETNTPIRSWNDIERSLSASGVAETVLNQDLAVNGTVDKGWDLMIPQALDMAPIVANPEDFTPRICISYIPHTALQDPSEMTPIIAEIVLKDVRRSGGGEPITSWEPGVRYFYYVSMRLDGGLLVELVTTPWDVVEAHTWGLLI